eukprot:13176471-Ditylum_brightwellii.AAC.2
MELLNINMYVASRGNHNIILLEQFFCFLNSGFAVIISKRDSTKISTEAIQLLTYAWNSAPIPLTNIS